MYRKQNLPLFVVFVTEVLNKVVNSCTVLVLIDAVKIKCH